MLSLFKEEKLIPSANENMDVANIVTLSSQPPSFSKKNCIVKWHTICVIAFLVSSHTDMC